MEFIGLGSGVPMPSAIAALAALATAVALATALAVGAHHAHHALHHAHHVAPAAAAPSITLASKEPVRFDSFRFRNFQRKHCFASARFGNLFVRFDAVQPAFLNASWFGPVLFGSVPRSVSAGPKSNGSVRFGSVRFGRSGSVSLLLFYNNNIYDT